MVESLNICEIAPQVVDQCHWIIRQDLSTDLAISNPRKHKHLHTLLIHQQHLNVQDRLGNGDKLYPYPPETTILKHHIRQQWNGKLRRSVSTSQPSQSVAALQHWRKISPQGTNSLQTPNSLTGFNTKRKSSPVHPLLLPKIPGKALKRRGDLKIMFTNNVLIRELRGNIVLHCSTTSQTNSTKTSRSLPSW